MATMIPPVADPESRSPGEQEIFDKLKHDPGAQNWIVLHSLDVARHRKQVSGEIDFVIILPGKGVLCVEVKAYRHVRCEQGMWYYGNKPGEARGPFKQAATAMHSIREDLVRQRPDLKDVVFWSAVVFPYAPFRANSPEWHWWQVIDNQDFRKYPLSKLFEGVLDHARAFLMENPGGAWFDPDLGVPTPKQCAAIAEILRPRFEFYESPQSRAKRLDDELKQYTEEQYRALDAMAANRRVAFCGPAGTGKTMLAIEAARRGKAAGRRVLLVCYNTLLGRWLEEQAAELRPQVVTKTLHGYMRVVAGSPEVGQGSEYWERVLPDQATERLLETGGEDELFDEIIIDEAQDILRENYLEFLNLLLKGGFASGYWRVFGDFEKQAIFEPANLQIDDFLERWGGGAPQYALRENCRNTPRIAELVHLLGELNPRYSKILRPDNGIEPEPLFYHDAAQQQKLLVEVLGKLYSEGYSGKEIVILSKLRDESCAARGIAASPWKERIRQYGQDGGYIRYTSIQRFKGMEAPVIIVTDIGEIGDAQATALFYIGITRALQRLVVLMKDSVMQEIVQRLHLA